MFSVIIPTYCRQRPLDRAIESVLSQSVDDLEIIVVDDASPETPQVPLDPRVRLIRLKSNRGVAHARNVGVETSSRKFLAFLDDDDMWASNRLALARDGLTRAPVAVCSQSPGPSRRLEGDVFDYILDGTTPNVGATALRRSAWVPFDEGYRSCEDVVWWLALSRRSPVASNSMQGLFFRPGRETASSLSVEQRIIDSQRLMAEYSPYFAHHPRAAAFRWKRIGLMHASVGRYSEARRAFGMALRLHPTAADLAHLIHTLTPSHGHKRRPFVSPN
jgi:glycosyltransferase involved in cell wall biosynthesis